MVASLCRGAFSTVYRCKSKADGKNYAVKVIMVNNMRRVHDALHIAQSAMRLAKQGIFFGMGASLVLMVLALLGHITPVFGAVVQEILDVTVILNALRLNFEKVK